MACTTILVGKNASYDGSTMIARNSDSPSGSFTPKRMTVVHPEEQHGTYRSVLSHVEVPLPDSPMRYTSLPNVLPDEGIWAGSGVNAENVAITATETITSNERVQAADPLVCLQPAADGKPEQPGGIGEEDLVTLVLPYVHTAKEGIQRLGSLHEKFGTYEMNAIALQDVNEIWWFESIGGHHWIARRVPDDAYVVMPNQLGIDRFDLQDALHEQKNCMCSPDLAEFIRENHLDLSLDGTLNPRDAFGSHSDSDHVYNTPRAWFMERFLNPHACSWDGPDADCRPDSDFIPWSRVPERKITVEDIKYLLSSYYQGTPFDPYANSGDSSLRGKYRPIGINRNDFLALIQIRSDVPEAYRAVEWVAFGSNAFNAMIPLYANADRIPAYLSNTSREVSTDSFYWASRLIGALADSCYGRCIAHIERYQSAVQARGHEIILHYDRLLKDAAAEKSADLIAKANQEIADMAQKETAAVLDKVLFEASCRMRNAYSRSDS